MSSLCMVDLVTERDLVLLSYEISQLENTILLSGLSN